MYCMHCGAEVSNNARFCPACGKALQQSAPGASNDLDRDGGNLNQANNEMPVKPVQSPVYDGTIRKNDVRPRGRIYRKRWFWVPIALILLLFVFVLGHSSGSKLGNLSENEVSENGADEAGGKEPEKIEGPAPVAETTAKVTPISDFWITLKDDHTITLRAFETHDETCIIASEYTIDGEKWPVKRIGDACFFGRTSLEYLVIPEGVESIEHNAFNSCSIETFYFPSTLKDITGIFDYLESGERTIYYAGSAEDWWAIEGADGVTDNIELIGNVPVPVVTDETDYLSAELTTEKSNAEQLGSSLGNAVNGIFKGFNDAMEEDQEEAEEE